MQETVFAEGKASRVRTARGLSPAQLFHGIKIYNFRRCIVLSTVMLWSVIGVFGKSGRTHYFGEACVFWKCRG